MTQKVLSKLDLSKEQVSKLLNIPVLEDYTTPPKKRLKPKHTRRWKTLPAALKEAIKQEPTTISHRQLAKKYNVSVSVVYMTRMEKVDKRKKTV